MLAVALALALVADTGRYTPSGLWYSVRGTGPAVVLVHGANLDSRSYTTVEASLSSGHRTILTDLRFHGRSRTGPGPFSFVADLEEVLDAAGVASATIVGHSLGATVAVDFALERPARVEGLVLIGPAIGGLPASRMPEGIAAVVTAVRAHDFPAAGRALARMPVMRLYRRPERQPAVDSIVEANTDLFRADPAWIRSVQPPAAARLGELRMPVLVVLGGRDPTEAGSAAAALVAGVPSARSVTFPDCGHLVPVECDDETSTTIGQFVAGVPRVETVSFPTPDGGRVSADVYGAGRSAVILAPGGRFRKESWAAQARPISASGFRVLAIDFRGRGNSVSGTAGAERVDLDVVGAIQYLRATGADSVSVVGASFGGVAAAGAATAHPGQIDQLILLAATSLAVPPEQFPQRTLFLVGTRDTMATGVPRLVEIREHYRRAPSGKRLVLLDSAAHAQFLFDTDQGNKVLEEILTFLQGR